MMHEHIEETSLISCPLRAASFLRSPALLYLSLRLFASC